MVLKVSFDVQATVKENFLTSVFSFSKKDFIFSRAIGITYQDLDENRFKSNFVDDLLDKPL